MTLFIFCSKTGKINLWDRGQVIGWLPLGVLTERSEGNPRLLHVLYLDLDYGTWVYTYVKIHLSIYLSINVYMYNE